MPNWKEKKPHWFEKYAWFFTSDNYLFVLGKTADQNEEIVSKHLEKNDLYFHSAVAGSGSGVLKISSQKMPSPTSLEECGAFLIAHSKAWNSGVPDKAYWVNPNQVSKTPETGEYVTKGSFIIRGKKNYLSMPKMIMGMTILYKFNDDVGFGYHQIDSEYTIDKITNAIPMIAPYSRLDNFDIKVKIITGKIKAGKALKNNIIPKFSKNDLMRSVIKKIPLDVFSRIMISNVRIS